MRAAQQAFASADVCLRHRATEPAIAIEQHPLPCFLRYLATIDEHVIDGRCQLEGITRPDYHIGILADLECAVLIRDSPQTCRIDRNCTQCSIVRHSI